MIASGNQRGWEFVKKDGRNLGKERIEYPEENAQFMAFAFPSQPRSPLLLSPSYKAAGISSHFLLPGSHSFENSTARQMNWTVKILF